MTELLTPVKPWSLTQKIIFRFFFLYILFYVFVDGFLGIIIHATPLASIWDDLIGLTGRVIFGVEEITVKPNGSGDTTYNYVQLFVILWLSVIGTLAWMRIDRDKLDHEKLSYGLRVFVRYYLGYILIVYGLAKVFKTQFPYPTYEMLARTYGESSPMGLLWTFMGFSYPYNLFTGLGETVGGVLLFFRRTTLLGALVIIGVMSNVVVLNFSYDVPVKIYSTHLLLMAFFLMLPDIHRLKRFFISNQSVDESPIQQLPWNKKFLRAGRILNMVVLVAMIGGNIYLFTKMPELLSRGQDNTPLYGQYKVTEFEPQILSNRLKWAELSVLTTASVKLTTVDGSEQKINWNADTENGTLDVFAFSDSMTSSIMYYTQPADSVLKIHGWFKGDSISVTLKEKSMDDFLLTGRGFHWINEYPFNQ